MITLAQLPGQSIFTDKYNCINLKQVIWLESKSIDGYDKLLYDYIETFEKGEGYTVVTAETIIEVRDLLLTASKNIIVTNENFAKVLPPQVKNSPKNCGNVEKIFI